MKTLFLVVHFSGYEDFQYAGLFKTKKLANSIWKNLWKNGSINKEWNKENPLEGVNIIELTINEVII